MYSFGYWGRTCFCAKLSPQDAKQTRFPYARRYWNVIRTVLDIIFFTHEQLHASVQPAPALQERRGQVQEDPFQGAFPFEVLSEWFQGDSSGSSLFFQWLRHGFAMGSIDSENFMSSKHDHYQSVVEGLRVQKHNLECCCFFRMNKGGLSIGLHSLPSILSKSSSGKSRSIFKGRLFILGLFFILGIFFGISLSLLLCFSASLFFAMLFFPVSLRL